MNRLFGRDPKMVERLGELLARVNPAGVRELAAPRMSVDGACIR
jgi:hypothetical protein